MPKNATPDTPETPIGTPPADGAGVDTSAHFPAQTPETANVNGEEVEADRVAAVKNDTGITNPVDAVKNTDAGPGNPDQRFQDPLAAAKIDPPRADDGTPLKTEETPKAIHDSVTAAGPREITNNVIPDMAERSPLVIAANALGIKLDPDWSDARIAAEIQMATEGRADLQVKGAVPPDGYGQPSAGATKGTPVKINRDYWDSDGTRIAAGTQIKLAKAEAQRLIDTGVAERTDPLPG
jgi:hypothetical protein